MGIPSALLLCLLAASGQAAPNKRLSAVALGEGEIRLDGRLDEPAWRDAPVGTGFVERSPYPGKRPKAEGVPTEIRVLYDAERLYVAVTSFTASDEAPRALELTRDSFSVFDDDAISLKIDVRLDQRTTVGFVTNPAGTQVDYVAVENGSGFRREFDAIWRVATHVFEDRWVAEFDIPFVALGLPGDPGDRVLGFQVTRDHNARQATYDWSEIPPQFGPVSALYYGRLEGLQEVAGGTPLTLIPYLLAGYDGPADDRQLKVGGDVRLRIGEDTWSEITVLTDFAQVDLDDPVVNLNRFALFFPERRPFFLSGLEVFEFGAGGLSQIFFSRRIGLDDDGKEVPLLGGVKVYGSQGDLRFGVLQAATQGTHEAAADNFTIARARYNFGEIGHVGLMGTLNGNLPFLTDDDVQDGGAFEPNYSFGADAALRLLERKLQLRGFVAGSYNAEGTDDAITGYSGQIAAEYLGLEVQPSATVSIIGEEFDPVIGFVARNNLLQSRVNLNYIYRTEAFGLRNINVYTSAMMERTADGDTFLGQRADTTLSAEWSNGVYNYLSVSASEDVVQEDFELEAADRNIVAGKYRGVVIDAGVNSPGRRNPVGNFAYSYSSAFFGGRLHQLRVSGTVSGGAVFRLDLGTNINLIDFDDQALRSAITVNGKISLTPDTKIALDIIAQANTTAEQAVALVRLRWRYWPGSDLFFVYRELMDFEGGYSGDRTVALKISHRFDLVF